MEIFSYTDKGKALAEELERFLASQNNIRALDEALIFVGAVGIAVRKITPIVKDKLTDPAVIVVDEMGKFVIPILSGHVGGANELAYIIAEHLGAIPVITTATDLNSVIAFDEMAASNGLDIVNRDNIKKVSGGLLKGKPVNVAIDDDVVITGDESIIDDTVLGLLYRPIVIGMGMRKDKDFESLDAFFSESLAKNDLSPKDVAGIASIDVKAKEPALIELSKKYDIPLYFFSAQELKDVEGEFEESEFVEATVGVSDVSARAAKALGKRGDFVVKKKKQDGMTISIFQKLRRITFEY